MSEFENYESGFNKIINQIERMIANAPNLPSDRKEKALIDIKYEFNEADQQIKQMDIEISSQPLHIKQQLQQKIKKYRNEWDNLRKKYIKIEETHNDDKRRESLMDGKIEVNCAIFIFLPQEYSFSFRQMISKEEQMQRINKSINNLFFHFTKQLSTVESNGKERFIKTGAMMSDGSYKLKGALREIYQIEDNANNIASNIYNQNKQLDKMIQDNTEIGGNISESNRLVDRIKRNIRRNKLVLCIVSFIIILAITTILWVKFSD